MRNDRDYLRKTYGVNPDELEKFSPAEVKTLVALCKESEVNPAAIIPDYETTQEAVRHLGAFSERAQLKGLFSDPYALLMFVTIVSHRDGENPFQYVGMTRDDYYAQKERVNSLVLPPEQQDTRVEKTIATMYRTLRHYEPSLRNTRVVGLLGGSFYFGDPSLGPDLDLDFVSISRGDLPQDVFSRLIGELTHDLEMPVQGRVILLESYQKLLQHLRSRRYQKIAYKDEFITDTSMILLAKRIVLYFCDTAGVMNMLDETITTIEDIVADNPLFRALLIEYFGHIEQDRRDKNRPVYDSPMNSS